MLAIEKNNCLTLFEYTHFCVKPHSYQLLKLDRNSAQALCIRTLIHR